MIWEDTNQNFIWFHISLSMKKENKEKCVSFASCKIQQNNRVTLKLCFELALMHMELFFIFFFSLISIWCVSMQSVLRVIFDKQLRYFLSQKRNMRRLHSFQIRNLTYVKFLKLKAEKNAKDTNVCMYVCVSMRNLVFDLRVTHRLCSFFYYWYYVSRIFCSAAAPGLWCKLGKKKKNLSHSWSTSRSWCGSHVSLDGDVCTMLRH